MNAWRPGLASAEHALLPDEDAEAWSDLLAGLIVDHDPAMETEAKLVHRLAAAL